jgi:hypothetical protein
MSETLHTFTCLNCGGLFSFPWMRMGQPAQCPLCQTWWSTYSAFDSDFGFYATLAPIDATPSVVTKSPACAPPEPPSDEAIHATLQELARMHMQEVLRKHKAKCPPSV